MGELAAKHMVSQGVVPLYVANRTWTRAQELARALPGTAVPFDELHEILALVDVVLTSAGAPEPIIRKEHVRHALRSRRGRPIFFIDIAVPRGVEVGVNDLENVFCYDIDDLGHVVDANCRERLREAQKAEALVEREVAKFLCRLKAHEVNPTIASLREKVETIRQGEVARTLAPLRNPSSETRAAIEALSCAIVNKILHAPTVKLRESSRQGASQRWALFVSELFCLQGHREAEDGTESVREMAGG